MHEFGEGEEEKYAGYKEFLAVVGVFFKLAEKSHPFITKLNLKKLKPIP